MAAVIMAVTVFVIALAALFIAYVRDSRQKAVLQERDDLKKLVDHLNEEIAEKDKELQARRLGLAWVETE